jgi:hypothetical protein
LWCAPQFSSDVLPTFSDLSLTEAHGAQNWLGLLIVALVLAYHFVVADPKFAQE